MAAFRSGADIRPRPGCTRSLCWILLARRGPRHNAVPERIFGLSPNCHCRVASASADAMTRQSIVSWRLRVLLMDARVKPARDDSIAGTLAHGVPRPAARATLPHLAISAFTRAPN